MVNGAQTLGSIGKCIAIPQEAAPASGYAFIKIISLEKCEDDRGVRRTDSRAANFQNQVSLGDFAAAYPFPWADAPNTQLTGSAITRIDRTPASDEANFAVEEALTACACRHTAKDCDLLYRVAAHRNSLRSLEMVFPPTQAVRTRHERVFPAAAPFCRRTT